MPAAVGSEPSGDFVILLHDLPFTISAVCNCQGMAVRCRHAAGDTQQLRNGHKAVAPFLKNRQNNTQGLQGVAAAVSLVGEGNNNPRLNIAQDLPGNLFPAGQRPVIVLLFAAPEDHFITQGLGYAEKGFARTSPRAKFAGRAEKPHVHPGEPVDYPVRTVQIQAEFFFGEPVNWPVGIGMVPQFMPFPDLTQNNLRVKLRSPAAHKKGGPYIILFQQIKDQPGGGGTRPAVKGKGKEFFPGSYLPNPGPLQQEVPVFAGWPRPAVPGQKQEKKPNPHHY